MAENVSRQVTAGNFFKMGDYVYITSLAKTIKIMSFLFAQSVREIVSNICCKKYIKLYSYFFHFSFLYGGPKRNFANTLEGKSKAISRHTIWGWL